MTITIYADTNIYRYVASGELEVITVGSIRFAYSSVHFDEIIRSDNDDALKGMEALKAVPVVTNENGKYNIDSIGVCLEYVNPLDKFSQYKSTYSTPDKAEESLNELLLRLLGADNYKELQTVPQSLLDLAEDSKEDLGHENLADKAQKTAIELEKFIEKDLSKRRTLTQAREEMGYPKGATSIHDKDENPIDAIWAHLEPKVKGLTKDQFFGFESLPIVGIERSRLGEVAGCHLILNMVGFHPDKGLPNREKIKNILSDGQHLGYGSICSGFLTSDYRLYRKTQAIYKYKNYPSQAIYVPYKDDGMSISLIEPGVVNRVKLERNSS